MWCSLSPCNLRCVFLVGRSGVGCVPSTICSSCFYKFKNSFDFFFPPVRWGVVRFYFSLLLPPSFLLRRSPRLFQPRAPGCSVARYGEQTRWTLSVRFRPRQCSPPDLNCDLPCPVFPAGPQPREGLLGRMLQDHAEFQKTSMSGLTVLKCHGGDCSKWSNLMYISRWHQQTDHDHTLSFSPTHSLSLQKQFARDKEMQMLILLVKKRCKTKE